MKEIRVSPEMLTELFKKDKIINDKCIKGLEEDDILVDAEFDRHSKILKLWFDKKDIEVVDVEFRKRPETKINISFDADDFEDVE